ncbi:MAG: glycosyltransferase family 4 protein [Balneolaceae bacterium]|nr:glycosyltransferase family 4 protein [Balneolaceae bacterium]
MNRKILIITYYWPPSGGSGVQRWVKFVKYLPEQGWEPIVYTPENPETPATDHSLVEDIPDHLTVLKKSIWEPYSIYKKITGKERVGTGFMNEKNTPGFLEAFFRWIRGNLFIPDARKYWIKPSVRYLKEYLDTHPVDILVSSGPPHSMHMIGLGINKQTDIPWLADFRDPWTNIDFYEDLHLSAWADRKHKKLEKEVLRTADRVTAVSPTMCKELEEIGERSVQLITNGFDSEDYSDSNTELDDRFTISHIGTMVKSRNPENLWRILAEMTDRNSSFSEDLVIKLIGKVDISVIETIEKYGLTPHLQKIDYMPHKKVIREQQRSRVLLLVLNDTPNARLLLPGKLFEYLAAQRPILCIGPKDGDVGEILNRTKSGYLVDYDETDKLEELIVRLYRDYENDRDRIDPENIEQFSRRMLTRELVSLLNSMTR